MANKQLVERHTIDYIPLAERRGKVWHLWPVWFAGDAHLATLAVGVIGIALGGNFFWTMVAIIAGSALGTFFMAFHATQGPQLGLPQLIQSRPQFGYMGALLVWVFVLVSYIGYNAFNQVLAAQALHQLAGADFAADSTIIIVFALLAALLAAVGYEWIHQAQRWVAYLVMASLTILTIGALCSDDLPAHTWTTDNFKAVPFVVQFFAAASYQLSWSMYVSDYSRYLPRDVGVGPSFWWTFVGAFIGGVWMMLVGTLGAALYPGAELTAALQSVGNAVWPGFGWYLLAASLLGLVTITTLNFYGASLALLTVADSFKPQRASVTARMLALALALIAATSIALVASKDFVHRFEELLAVLLYLFTPWTAINLVDFYWVRKGHYSIREIFNPNGIYGRWSWRGLVAYAGGFIAMIPCFKTGVYTGVVAQRLGGADVSMLVGLPVATIIYLLACRSLDVEGERAAAQLADRNIED